MFAAFAISLVMLAFAFDPSTALKAGGILGLVLTAILIWYAQTAPRRLPRDTETWLLLKEEARPQSDHGMRTFASILAEVYLFYASHAFVIAVALLAGGVLLSLLGVKSSLA